MKLYGSSAVQELVTTYVEQGGECFIEIVPGSLGWGLTILHDSTGNLKTYIIKEVALSAWSSGHKIRGYNKIPKKYQEILNNLD